MDTKRPAVALFDQALRETGAVHLGRSLHAAVAALPSADRAWEAMTEAERAVYCEAGLQLLRDQPADVLDILLTADEHRQGIA